MENKDKIINALKQFVTLKGSQNKAATALGISAATLSKILNGKTDDIADEMWRILAAKTGSTGKRQWFTAQTGSYNQLMFVFANAQNDALACAVCGEAGCGKSTAAAEYASTHENVALLTCAEYWNKRQFLSALLSSYGIGSDGLSVGEMMDTAVENIKRMETPLVILDEADKLSDSVLYFFITLYNQLEDCAGLVLMATDFLKKRIEKGVKNCKKGYKEIYSRIGRKFICILAAGREDVAAACAANSLTDEKEINRIYADCQGDFRRVKRAVWATLKKAA